MHPSPSAPPTGHQGPTAPAADQAVAPTPWARWAVAIGLGLVLLPLVTSAVHLTVIGDELHPTSDLAAIELATRDVGHHAVLLGPHSRDGWYHPGPLATYLYAVPYRLLGSTSAAMSVAALLVNGAALAGMVIVARRRGGTPLALAAAVICALLVRSLGPEVLRVPWNPSVTVLPYGLLVLLTWSLLCRDRWALPVSVLVASFVAQTHVGYVALALPLLVVGVVGLVVGTVRPPGADEGGAPGDGRARLRTLARPAAAALAVGVVAWAPPVYEQLTRAPGNFGAIVEWFRSGGGDGEPSRGWVGGWRLVSGQYAPVPEWIAGARAPGVFTGEPRVLDDPVLPVLLPLVVLAVVVLARRRIAGAAALGLAWAVASAVGVLATARVIGPVYAYRTGWSLVLGGVGGLLVGWWVVRTVAERAPSPLRRALVPVTVAGLAVLAVTTSATFVRAGVPEAELAAQLEAVGPATLAALPPGDGAVVVDGRSGWDSIVQAPGLVLELERRGVDARLPAGSAVAPHRVDDGGPVRARLLLAAGESIPRVAAGRDRTLVASTDGLAVFLVTA